MILPPPSTPAGLPAGRFSGRFERLGLLAKRVLREPLVHFLIAGAVVYVVLADGGTASAERRIVVDQAEVERLSERWSRTYMRAPTREELRGLVDEYVRDQVYYREALRLGLDRNDEVVVRRMHTKLISLASLSAEMETPDAAVLQALIDANPERYGRAASYGFEQVWLGADTPEVRKLAQAILGSGKDANIAVERFASRLPVSSLGFAYAAITPADIAQQFGQQFASAVSSGAVGQWRGPVPSGYGLHLVRVTRITPARPPVLDDVRQRVETDWRANRVAELEDAQFRKMAKRYVIDAELAR